METGAGNVAGGEQLGHGMNGVEVVAKSGGGQVGAEAGVGLPRGELEGLGNVAMCKDEPLEKHGKR